MGEYLQRQGNHPNSCQPNLEVLLETCFGSPLQAASNVEKSLFCNLILRPQNPAARNGKVFCIFPLGEGKEMFSKFTCLQFFLFCCSAVPMTHESLPLAGQREGGRKSHTHAHTYSHTHSCMQSQQ